MKTLEQNCYDRKFRIPEVADNLTKANLTKANLTKAMAQRRVVDPKCRAYLAPPSGVAGEREGANAAS